MTYDITDPNGDVIEVLKDLANKLDTLGVSAGASAAGENHIGSVGGAKVTATVSFARPADSTPYAAKDNVGVNLAVTGATNASPIVVTTATHSLADGDPVTIASVGGNTNANGSNYAKVTGYSGTTFGLYSDKALTTPVAGNADFTSGGTVARLLRFPNVGRLVGASGYVVKATLLTDQTTNVETFRLHLFHTPPAAILDNAQCSAPLYADAAKYAGTIQFVACSTEGTGATSAYSNMTPNTPSSNLPLAFVCAAADRDLFGILECPLGFTPASGQQVLIKLSVEQD